MSPESTFTYLDSSTHSSVYMGPICYLQQSLLYIICAFTTLAVLLVPASVKCKVTLRDTAFQSAAPKLWNTIPKEIRQKDETIIMIMKNHQNSKILRNQNPLKATAECNNGHHFIIIFF